MSSLKVLKTFFLCLLLGLDSPASATSVLQFSFSELVQKSEMIFEGRVAHVSVVRDKSSGAIWTRVRFQVQEVIKGSRSDRWIDLPFLGGTVGDLTLRIGEMHVPELGEAGIYFIESLARRQPNPLLGWAQGHFVIRTTQSGLRQIVTPDGDPVLFVNEEPESEPRGISSGTASGISLGSREQSVNAMPVYEFKDEIERVLSSRPGN